MQRFLRSRLTASALAATAATLTFSAQAQVTSSDATVVAQAAAPASSRAYARDDAYSLLPYTRRGYFGIHLSQSDFKGPCGSGGYACDKSDTGFSLYTGGLFNDYVGMEVGYMNTGNADRAGGRTRAQGVNVSLVLRAPLGGFNVFAKGGAVYGQTEVSHGLLSDVPVGKRRGWGSVYGAGIGYDFTPTSGVVLEWARNELRFPGNSGRQDIDTTSLGYIHRF